jgi:hypothetical protein
MEAGCCLGSEGNGVSLGEGVRKGPAPRISRKISSQCSAREEAPWRRMKKDKSAVMKKNDWWKKICN